LLYYNRQSTTKHHSSSEIEALAQRDQFY